jgi:hypothetical protein
MARIVGIVDFWIVMSRSLVGTYHNFRNNRLRSLLIVEMCRASGRFYCAGILQERAHSGLRQVEEETESRTIPVRTMNIKNGPIQGHNISIKQGN